MPLLTLTTSKESSTDTEQALLSEIADTYAERMDSDTDFLAIKYRTAARETLWLGRADPDKDVFVLEADVRAGRPLEQRRAFAVAVMDYLHEEHSIPHPNMKVVFTEHEGSHMMGYTRVGSDWEVTSN
jgi:5-carboxymethyl-2-hydroxymuconate isomerase